MHKGLRSLDLVTQDGTRTRASASAPSFRSFGSLLQCREQAAPHLKAVLADDTSEHTKTERARREATARDYQVRVEAAIDAVKALQAGCGEKKTEARASDTERAPGGRWVRKARRHRAGDAASFKRLGRYPALQGHRACGERARCTTTAPMRQPGGCFRTSVTSVSRERRASPKSMRVLSRQKSGFSTPA
jgi:hypothetical protein